MGLEIAVSILLAIIGAGAALVYVFREGIARIIWPFSPPDHELIIVTGWSIVGFELLPNGQIAGAPGRVIHGDLTGLYGAFAVALDHQNRIWVGNIGTRPGDPNNEPSITVYESNANGNVRPIRTTPVTQLGFGHIEYPSAIAIRPHPENLLVADGILGGVFEFGIASGQDVPTGAIEGSLTRMATPSGIGLDLAGRIYVAEPTENAILVFTAQANQFINAPPGASITGLNTPAHIALDTQDQLFVVNRGSLIAGAYNNPRIRVYAPGATGNASPVRTIQGLATTLYDPLGGPYGIAVNEEGRVFVSCRNKVLVFAVGATGNVAPERVLDLRDIGNPIGLTVR